MSPKTQKSEAAPKTQNIQKSPLASDSVVLNKVATDAGNKGNNTATDGTDRKDGTVRKGMNRLGFVHLCGKLDYM
jgi:hypothetical protein